MTETIKLMKAHTSVRHFKEQEIPQADLEDFDCWTNGVILEKFQSHSEAARKRRSPR